MNRLKELRKEKKLTQQNMADLLGMSRRGYQKIENGESQLKTDKAEALADYFGVSVGYLLGYEDKNDWFLSRIEVKTMSDFLVQKGQSDEYRQGVKNLEELIVARLEEKFSDFYSSVLGEEIENENRG